MGSYTPHTPSIPNKKEGKNSLLFFIGNQKKSVDKVLH